MVSRRLRVLILVAASVACPQDIDTIVFSNNRKPLTFLDQIEDRRERNAFLRLYRERRPQERKHQAEAFLNEWPQSWLLPQVYEIAAKAAIDLEDYPAALQYGKQSLRLFPENPLLLVPLANVQVLAERLEEAASSAREALEYMERFARPAAIDESAWPTLERELRASSHYALGRVAVTQALSNQGEKRREQLQAALHSLSQARQLNPDDPEIAYLLGLAQLALGNQAAAASAFAASARITGPLQSKAQEQLRLLKWTGDEPVESKHQVVEQPEAHTAEYAGSEVCAACHRSQHASWQHTGMARMFQPYKPENVLGDFNQALPDEAARVRLAEGRHYFAVRDRQGGWAEHPVDYTVGSKWQQAYATSLPGGEIQVFPLQYNKLQKRWLNYWKMIDPPDSPRIEVQNFQQVNRAFSYRWNCAPCHTSQLRIVSGEPVFREHGVNCEMCHGPSAAHVKAMNKGNHPRQPADPPVSFRRIGNREYVAICAQCHAQSAMRDPRPQGEWNYSETGLFYRTYPSRPFVEFSRKAFYKDGRFRETTFIVEAFLRTACYRRGQAHCGHCHDPHPANPQENSKSLKFLDKPDEMCLQCHGRFRTKVEAHTHHGAGSEGSRCVSCHMPRIVNSVLFEAASHQTDDKPGAEMTERFGQRESPNACLECHTTKDVGWLKQQLQSW
jgi:tetratricopeptide (TPR) repeat protein